MADTTEALIYVRERRLPYETFDADNHLYENQDALTKFLPKEYEGAVRYVDIEGRTKIAIRDQISNYIPNPTFSRVAVPGGWNNSAANKGDGGVGGQTGVKPKVMPGIDAFFDPEPRLALMKDMGIDRTLLWPTLASVLEERVADDPDLAVAIIHALNQWMHEHWTFVYSDAIFATPIVSLAAGVGPAIEELQYVHERGAKIFLLRVAPVPTWKGRKSFALPEFDPFWEAVAELDIVVGMHSGDSGYQRHLNEWNGITTEHLPFKATGSRGFQALKSESDVVQDGMASIIGHGLATRFPTLKFMPVEYWAGWIRPFVNRMRAAYEKSAVLFDEDPFEVFTRNIYPHIFHEPDPQGLLDLGLPADRLMFGSDFPHPEGMGDPLAYSEVVENLTAEEQELIMGGTLAKALKVGKYAACSAVPTEPICTMVTTDDVTPASPRSAKGARTRARLVEAGKEVFEEDGLVDARIAAIAERAGVSYGSFYHYFDSKESLFREVAAGVGERLSAPVGDVIYARNSDVTPQDRIHEAMRRHFETYREEARILRAIEQAERLDEEVGASRALRRSSDSTAIADSIRLLQRRGLADPALDADIAAAALGAMTYRFAELWLARGAIECDFDAGVDTVARLFVNALGLDTT